MDIYLSLTTTNKKWPLFLGEIEKQHISSLCLFPTMLNQNERMELYRDLQSLAVTDIPFVHLRHDSTPEEVQYLRDTFCTQMFVIHPKAEYGMRYDLSGLGQYIYIETTKEPFVIEEVSQYAGICLDIAHAESHRKQNRPLYNNYMEYMRRYPVRIVHISAVRETAWHSTEKDCDYSNYDYHWYATLAEFDYVKRYVQFFTNAVVALELEDSFGRQRKVQAYIKKLICANEVGPRV